MPVDHSHTALGSFIVILTLVVIPSVLLKLPELRVRHAAILWALGWLVGLGTVFGRRRT